jgi:hypothetical protein
MRELGVARHQATVWLSKEHPPWNMVMNRELNMLCSTSPMTNTEECSLMNHSKEQVQRRWDHLKDPSSPAIRNAAVTFTRRRYDIIVLKKTESCMGR